MTDRLKDADKERWQGYLRRMALGTCTELDHETLVRLIQSWQRTPVNEDGDGRTKSVGKLNRSHILVTLLPPEGVVDRARHLTLGDIQNADKVIRYFLAQGKAPKPRDFRMPPEESGATGPIQDVNYAPRFAERAQRALLDEAAAADGTVATESKGK